MKGAGAITGAVPGIGALNSDPPGAGAATDGTAAVGAAGPPSVDPSGAGVAGVGVAGAGVVAAAGARGTSAGFRVFCGCCARTGHPAAIHNTAAQASLAHFGVGKCEFMGVKFAGNSLIRPIVICKQRCKDVIRAGSYCFFPSPSSLAPSV